MYSLTDGFGKSSRNCELGKRGHVKKKVSSEIGFLGSCFGLESVSRNVTAAIESNTLTLGIDQQKTRYDTSREYILVPCHIKFPIVVFVCAPWSL